jgi:N-glycosidase YbiA
MTDAPVTFYSGRGRYGGLSNFANIPVTIRGVRYPTGEHAYQAWKATSQVEHDRVVAAPTPKEAKRRGRYQNALRPDWEDVHLPIMAMVLHLKLVQNRHLQTLLADTGGRIITEDSPRDAYWGVGPNGDGANHLGVLWMAARARFTLALPSLTWAENEGVSLPPALCPSRVVVADLESVLAYRQWAGRVLFSPQINAAQVEAERLTNLRWSQDRLVLRASENLAGDLHMPTPTELFPILDHLARWPVPAGCIPSLFPRLD